MKVGLQLAHLKSYAHMGTALVRCASGCVCNATLVDGTNTARFSQLLMHDMRVSASRACVLTITIQQVRAVRTHWTSERA